MCAKWPFLARYARMAPWHRNPLMRGGPRIDAVAMLLAATVVLLLVPIAAACGTVAYADEKAAAQTARLNDREVTAVLLAPAQPAWGAETDDTTAHRTHASAQWVVDAIPHTGNVTVARGAEAGNTTTIWVDKNGRVVPPPATDGHVRADAIGIAVTAWMFGSAAVAAAQVLVRRWNWAHRMKQWECEWDRFDRHRGWSAD
jgi:hypothetical protein